MKSKDPGLIKLDTEEREVHASEVGAWFVKVALENKLRKTEKEILERFDKGQEDEDIDLPDEIIDVYCKLLTQHEFVEERHAALEALDGCKISEIEKYMKENNIPYEDYEDPEDFDEYK